MLELGPELRTEKIILYMLGVEMVKDTKFWWFLIPLGYKNDWKRGFGAKFDGSYLSIQAPPMLIHWILTKTLKMSHECGGGDGWVAPYSLEKRSFGCVFYLWKFQKKCEIRGKNSLGEIWLILSGPIMNQCETTQTSVFLGFWVSLQCEMYLEHCLVCVFTPYAHAKHALNVKDETKQIGFMRVGRIYQVLVMVLMCGWRYSPVPTVSWKVQVVVVELMVRKMCLSKCWFYAITLIFAENRKNYPVYVGGRDG